MAETSYYSKGDERPPGIDPRSPRRIDPDARRSPSTQTPPTSIPAFGNGPSRTPSVPKRTGARGAAKSSRFIAAISRSPVPRRAKNVTSSYAHQAGQSRAFNILYANTEVMLPAAYSKPPDPVVKSRFVKKSPPDPPPADDAGMMPSGDGPSGNAAWPAGPCSSRGPWARRALILRALGPREHRACRWTLPPGMATRGPSRTADTASRGPDARRAGPPG